MFDAYRYRGRHRVDPEPSALPRAATATAIAFSAPLLAPGAAAADPPGGWDRIIACESGGKNIHTQVPGPFTAQGYFQITNGTWKANGGTRYAPTALGASFEEQRAVANRIYETRGSLADWNASRSCWGKTSAAPVKAPRAKHRTERPAEPVARSSAPKHARGDSAVPNGYVVQSGDTLWKIAKRYRVPGGPAEIAKASGVRNVDRIYVGQRLR